MIPIIGFAGKSGSGKTTLLEKVVRELTVRGLRVGVIKHTRHEAGLDTAGKDTDRYASAGAAAVALSAARQVGIYFPAAEPWKAEEVARLFPEVDLILVEGYHDAQIPRVWVMRRVISEELPETKGLIGYVTDLPVQTELPVFGFEDAARVADLCHDYVKRLGPRRDVHLWVNDRKILIKPFIKDFFLNTISAMVASLRDTQAARRIMILIDKPAGEREDD